MRILFLATFCCVAAVAMSGCSQTQSGEKAGAPDAESLVKNIDDATFDAAIAKGVVLVDFWAPWCGPCRMQGPIVAQVAQDVQGTAAVAKLNVDQAPKTAKRFSIASIPTLIVFKDGKPAKQFVGVTRAEELVAAIKSAK